MPAPQISIIMAVYNGEDYIELAIDSVLSQGYTDYEFIIVDDCSTDRTPDIILSVQDSRIQYTRNRKNLGQTPSLNIGLKLAKGRYIARIDADDIYLPGKLQKQFNFMEKNNNVVVCGTNGLKIDTNAEIIGTFRVPHRSKDIFFNIFFGSPLIHVSVIMRRSIIIENGGYDEKFPYCADFALWSKLIKKKYTVVNLPVALIKFRAFEGSLGVVNKFGPSGKEATNIIYSNISALSNISFSKKECETILFMLWPSSGSSINDLTNVYKKLCSLAKEFYNTRIPLRASFKLNALYLKSLVKRGIYYKSHCQVKLIKIEFLKIIRSYYKNPVIIIIAIMSFISVSIFSEKNIKRFF
jgi:glycosyltransferase involved in cell wall biosynthesis